MSETRTVLKGVIHGKTIELEQEPGLPDGQEVRVTLQPSSQQETLPPGEGIRRSAGTWAEDPEGLDSWLEEMQRSRQIERTELT